MEFIVEYTKHEQICRNNQYNGHLLRAYKFEL